MRPSLRAALLGAAGILGFAPFELFPLPILALALLFRLWRRAASPSAAAWLGFCYGLGLFLAGVSWVYVSLHDVGGMAAPVAFVATLLFCAYLALFPALAGYACHRLASLPRGLPSGATGIPAGHADFSRDALLLAGVWTAGEWLRGTLFTGFPWLALGYSQTPPSPLAGYAAVLGGYGIAGLAALMAAVLALAPRRRATWLLIAALAGGGALLRGMDWTQPVGAPFSVSLLQGNIPQSLKWEPERLPLSIDAYTRLARDNPASLVVLPETALPLFFDQVPREVWQALTQHGDALVGIAVRHRDGGYVNGAVAVSPSRTVPPAPTFGSGRYASPSLRSDEPAPKAGADMGALTVPPAPTFTVESYAKRHLVPFGEYVPPGFAWFFDLVRIPMSNFSAGPSRQPPLAIAGQRIAPNICYEDLFGAEILSALPAATLLVNLSNTAWFGDSLAQPQHLQIARLRALETGRMMLRATNTGITAAIAPDGRVLGALPPFTAGALRVEAQGYAGLTPYGRWGDLPALLLAICAVLPGFMAAWRGRRSR